MFSFLRYYVRLRLEVLLGRHKTTHPLDLRYRWRQWQYTKHLKWLKERGWLEEDARAPEPPASAENEAPMRRVA